MRAMVTHAPGERLRLEERPCPIPGYGEVLINVRTCGVCRTDLHIIDGELPRRRAAIVPGHEIVGSIERCGEGVRKFRRGERVGIGWLAGTCGQCRYCRAGKENLCPQAEFTGLDRDGGFADYVVAKADYCIRLPSGYSDVEAAPLLCAGCIGYRALLQTGDGPNLGIYGFGAAGHLAAQLARNQGRNIYAFTKPENRTGQEFARRSGAVWAGGSDEMPPDELDAAVLFAPAGTLVPQALKAVHPGGCIVCGGIHMSDIPSFPYALLWGERSVASVANIRRADSAAFMTVAGLTKLKVTATIFPLEAANEALAAMKHGWVKGAIVLDVNLRPAQSSALHAPAREPNPNLIVNVHVNSSSP